MIHDGIRRPGQGQRDAIGPDGKPLAEQPKWRRDFPVDWADDEYVSRRDLVKFMSLTSAAFVAGHVWLAMKTLFRSRGAERAPQRIAAVHELEVGQAKTFTHEATGTPCLLVKMAEDSYVAYDQQCTHLLCPVVPVFESKRLHCPCHNGWFDLETGHVIAGPPRRPLPRVSLEVRDGLVYAAGLEEPLG